MATTKVNYEKIYEYLKARSGKIITACGIAQGIGVDCIYGGTMSKLVRDGAIDKCALKGHYRVIIWNTYQIYHQSTIDFI